MISYSDEHEVIVTGRLANAAILNYRLLLPRRSPLIIDFTSARLLGEWRDIKGFVLFYSRCFLGFPY